MHLFISIYGSIYEGHHLLLVYSLFQLLPQFFSNDLLQYITTNTLFGEFLFNVNLCLFISINLFLDIYYYLHLIYLMFRTLIITCVMWIGCLEITRVWGTESMRQWTRSGHYSIINNKMLQTIVLLSAFKSLYKLLKNYKLCQRILDTHYP